MLAGVFGFLDASLPESLRSAAAEKNFGVGRTEKPCDESYFIAKILNANFRLQWRECPLRKHLANYRLYHRDDMAAALTSAYGRHKRGQDPEAALLADYAMGFHGLLFHEDVEEFKKAAKESYHEFYWNHLRPFYEPGDRVVKYDTISSGGYLLVRGDRLVWEVESIHKCVVGISLKWQAERDHFIALGGSKAFLNGEFVWPPDGWVNSVSDAEETASLSKRPMFDFKEQSRGVENPADGISLLEARPHLVT